ncbi:efflux RND transporter periplasmic adaptor subunit [Azospirillum oleiclasticum]
MSTDTQTSTTVGHDAVRREGAHGERRPVRRRSTVLRLIIVAVLMALLLGGLWWFNEFRNRMIADFFAGNKPPPTPVAVAEATLETVPKFLTAIGTLEAVRQVTVSPEVAGRITQIFFESGAAVKAGAPLVQLNDQTEQADLLAQRAQARLAELNLERSLSLRRNQAGPQTTVDQNRAELDEVNANIKRTESTIAQKLIRAPFDGNLGIRQVNVGQYLTAGATVVTLTDLSTLLVNFTLPEQSRERIHVGQELRIASDAFPGRSFPATITTIEPQVSEDTRAIKVQGTLENRDRVLLPGMFANVQVVLPPETGVVVVPETAVDYTLYGDSVFVVREKPGSDGKPALTAERVPVTAGDRGANRVEIRRGVKPGERVIVSGQLKLSNGAAVTIAEGAAPPTPERIPVN